MRIAGFESVFLVVEACCVEGKAGPVVPAPQPVEDDGGDAVDGRDEGEEEDHAEHVVLVLVADARLEGEYNSTLSIVGVNYLTRQERSQRDCKNVKNERLR